MFHLVQQRIPDVVWHFLWFSGFNDNREGLLALVTNCFHGNQQVKFLSESGSGNYACVLYSSSIIFRVTIMKYN